MTNPINCRFNNGKNIYFNKPMNQKYRKRIGKINENKTEII